MTHANFLVFDDFDNPMHLSKVGNWIITFVSPRDQLTDIVLAITYVLPRQISEALQPRRVLIQQTENMTHWKIQHIECYDSQSQQELILDTENPVTQKTLELILQEFSKYDVDVTLA